MLFILASNWMMRTGWFIIHKKKKKNIILLSAAGTTQESVKSQHEGAASGEAPRFDTAILLLGCHGPAVSEDTSVAQQTLQDAEA